MSEPRRPIVGATQSAARLLTAHAALLVVTVVWFNSYLMGDWVHYYKQPGRLPPLFVHASSHDGVLLVSWARTLAMYEPGWDSSFRTGTTLGGDRWRGTAWGFDVQWRAGAADFQAPYWFLALLASVPALRSWRGRSRASRRRRAAAAGRCPACGYDLRASPARCPECGWPPERAPAR